MLLSGDIGYYDLAVDSSIIICDSLIGLLRSFALSNGQLYHLRLRSNCHLEGPALISPFIHFRRLFFPFLILLSVRRRVIGHSFFQ